MEQEFPATNKGWGVRLETLYDSMLDERVRPSLLVLLAAVGMVLLIACANVANVLLARGISRQRELALRTALGAARSRLIRQLFTESVCLAAVSGACGLLLAVFAVEALQVMLPPTLPRIDEVRVDATVLGVSVLLSLASGLLVGLVPAIRASRAALVPSLVQQGKGLAGSSRMLLRHGIVAAQMALATMLLVGATLLLQSFIRLQAATRSSRLRAGRCDHREGLAAPRQVSRPRAHMGLLSPAPGIAQRHATGTGRGDRNDGTIRARRTRGRQGSGPCPGVSLS
jgi:putative ABC transport system permease protein